MAISVGFLDQVKFLFAAYHKQFHQNFEAAPLVFNFQLIGNVESQQEWQFGPH